MSTPNIESLKCEPCSGGVEPLSSDAVLDYMKTIDDGWQFNEQPAMITKSFRFKNFAKTMFFVNALAHLADQQGHHPDVAFGYNYCRVSFTTHEAKGLTINDFICAKQVDLIQT